MRSSLDFGYTAIFEFYFVIGFTESKESILSDKQTRKFHFLAKDESTARDKARSFVESFLTHEANKTKVIPESVAVEKRVWEVTAHDFKRWMSLPASEDGSPEVWVKTIS